MCLRVFVYRLSNFRSGRSILLKCKRAEALSPEPFPTKSFNLFTRVVLLPLPGESGLSYCEDISYKRFIHDLQDRCLRQRCERF